MPCLKHPGREEVKLVLKVTLVIVRHSSLLLYQQVQVQTMM